MNIDDLNDVPDIDFLLACRDGDLDAFGALYGRHAATVVQYAWSVTGSRTAAEDILQETFATAWATRNRATIVDVSLLPWLLSICRNHLRNKGRRILRRQTFNVESIPESSSTDQLAWVRDALDELTPGDRRVCEPCLVEGRTYKEAAGLIGSTPAAVGKRLQRARARLRDLLTNYPS